MFIAIINVPGYLPMDDEPPIFDTAAEAWEYLWTERLDNWSNYDYADYMSDAALADMEHKDGIGTVYGNTPGYDGDHDLGLAYSVSVAEDWI